MNQEELQKLAGQYFIADSGLNPANLIRKIQIVEGHADCYATGKTECGEIQCRWRTDCLGGASEPEPSRTAAALPTEDSAPVETSAITDGGPTLPAPMAAETISKEPKMDSGTASTRVEIASELAIFNAEAIREQLLAALERGTDVDVDLSAVSEIDSAGLQLLIAAKHEAVRHGRTLRLYGDSGPVAGLLELYDLAGFFADRQPIASESL